MTVAPDDLRQTIEHALQRAPQWARSDLSSNDPALRSRAEDALAAMIFAAVEQASQPLLDS